MAERELRRTLEFWREHGGPCPACKEFQDTRSPTCIKCGEAMAGGQTPDTWLPDPDFSCISLTVHEKGAVSVCGLGQFPVTLYTEQWEKLLALKGDIATFIAAN